MQWIYLSLSILGEILGTSALKESAGFTKFYPTLLVFVGYSIAFYFLSITLKYIPIGITYAIWSGVGIIMISAIGYFRFGQIIDTPAIIGLILIVSGVLIINIFSNSTTI